MISASELFRPRGQKGKTTLKGTLSTNVSPMKSKINLSPAKSRALIKNGSELRMLEAKYRQD